MVWTMRDYIRRWRWGPHKTLLRTALMDVAVYECLARGDVPQAQAQLVQNLKAKQQAAIANGGFEAAWLLTGLPDPFGAPKMAGEGHEMATVTGYLAAVAELEKKAAGANRRGQLSEDDDGEGESRPMSASAKKKAAKKAAAAAKAKAQTPP